MDWSQASANTHICEAKNITLRDVVQSMMYGANSEESIMDMLQMNPSDAGADLLPEIVEFFLPIVEIYKSGGCKSACAGCSGGCGENN